MAKSGRWTNKENDFFVKNVNRLTDEEMAQALDRSVEGIKEKKRAMNIGKTRLDVEHKFEQAHQWKMLNKELSKEEMEFFTAEYANLTGQFQGDILPIEENQIFMLIKVSIMQNRCQAGIKTATEQLERARKIHLDTLQNIRGEATETEKEKIERTAAHIQALETANKVRGQEWQALLKSYSDILKDLKGTRNQRLEKATSGRKTMLDLLKYMDEKKNKDAEGQFLELGKKGIDKEYRRLSKDHH